MTATWTLWAVLLIAHGAFTRWARTAARYATVSIFGDALLIAIALITLDQLQQADSTDFVRIGLFFVAFGFLGRQMMGSLLKRAPVKMPPRAQSS